MWNSKRIRVSSRPDRRGDNLAAIARASLLGLVPLSIWMHPGRIARTHPVWIVVFFLSAWLGSAGFLGGVVLAVGAVTLESVIEGGGLSALWSRVTTEPDMAALGASLVVAWITSLHSRRLAHLREREKMLSEHAAEAEEAARRLRDLVALLRARVEHASSSLSFLRRAASRLEGRDPKEAAEAAADLALARTGASAIAVRTGAGKSRNLLVARDVSGLGAYHSMSPDGPDFSVPIRAGDVEVGVMELWGVPGRVEDEATTHDLEIIAAWCAQAIAQISSQTPEMADCRPEAP